MCILRLKKTEIQRCFLKGHSHEDFGDFWSKCAKIIGS